MDIVDRIEAIKHDHEDCWQNPEALAKARAVWAPECQINDSGIFSPCPREIVARCGNAPSESGAGTA